MRSNVTLDITTKEFIIEEMEAVIKDLKEGKTDFLDNLHPEAVRWRHNV